MIKLDHVMSNVKDRTPAYGHMEEEDSLTTRGYATKEIDHMKALDIIIQNRLASLQKGLGMIPVLVTPEEV